MLQKIKFWILFFGLSSTLYAQPKKGMASYYANKFEGRRCASGEIFSNQKLTCAHKTLPFGTLLKVCTENNKCVTVKVNDRLPKRSKRIIDLSTKAANQIGLNFAGQMKVTIAIVGKDSIHAQPHTLKVSKKFKKKRKKSTKRKN